ncbi:MAG: hypothetical protein ACI37U_02485 [Bacteroides sp.]
MNALPCGFTLNTVRIGVSFVNDVYEYIACGVGRRIGLPLLLTARN